LPNNKQFQDTIDKPPCRAGDERPAGGCFRGLKQASHKNEIGYRLHDEVTAVPLLGDRCPHTGHICKAMPAAVNFIRELGVRLK
jgi:hypothetical protein